MSQLTKEKLDLSKPCWNCVHHCDEIMSCWYSHCFNVQVREDHGSHDPVLRDFARGRGRICGPSGRLFAQIQEEPPKPSLWKRIFG